MCVGGGGGVGAGERGGGGSTREVREGCRAATDRR